MKEYSKPFKMIWLSQ